MGKRILSQKKKIKNYASSLFIFKILIIIYSFNLTFSDDNTSPIDTETLTRIIRYSLNDASSNYATITTTPNGNLICSASYYSGSTIKYYYGLKPNGRPYFKKNGVETEFQSTDSDKGRNEGFLYGVQLSDTSSDNKEYIFVLSNNDANIEVYDFSTETPTVYSQDGKTFFNTYYNFFRYGSIFKLKDNSSGNTYIASVTLLHTDNNNYVDIFKFSFSSPNIATNSPIAGRYPFVSAKTYSSSCFEDDNNIIICFGITTAYAYTLAAFDYNFVYKQSFFNFINGKYADDIFYKAVHFYGNVGAYLYFDLNYDINIYIMKFESLNFNKVFNDIKITNNNYYNFTSKNDLIKIEDKKICYSTLSTDSKELNLFIITNIVDTKLLIRHYTIKTYEKNNFLFNREYRLTYYNDYIAMATVGTFDSVTDYSYLIIFSYPNSTDYTFDITELIKNGTKPIINFKEKCKIENNIFGYEQEGVKIKSIPTGLKLFNEEDKTQINEGDIITKNVEVFLEEDIDSSNSQFRIEYALVAKDAPYSSFKDYSEITNINLCYNDQSVCEEETYYSQRTHEGRTSYYDLIINLEQISSECQDNCVFCDHDTKECFICKDSFWKSEDDNKKCTNITKEPSTILIIPTTEAIVPSTNPKIETTAIIIPSTLQVIQESTNLNNGESQGKTCTVSEILNNQCLDGQIRVDQLEDIKNNILNEDYEGQNTIVETETVIIQVSKLDDQENQENEKVSNIDLGKCEDLLRQEYDLSADEDLIVYKVDIKTSDSSATYVTYEIYDSDLNKLSLDVCSETQITIQVPVKVGDNLQTLAESLGDSGYNLFDEDDSFYNDICATYTSENGTDMLLSDRKNDIYSATENLTLCQTDCELESYNATSKKAKCNCDVATSTTVIESLDIDNLFSKKEIAKSFYDTLANSNFLVMKCYKLIFDGSLIFKNYGEIIMTILTLLFLIMMIIYFILGGKKIHRYLVSILKWNLKNKVRRSDAESVANNEDRKVIFNNNNNDKKEKKIKIKNNNAPPKRNKIKNKLEFSSVMNNNNYTRNTKNSKLVPLNNEIEKINSETIINKKHKMNRIKEEKFKQSRNKDDKKMCGETEANTKKEIAISGYKEITKRNYNDTELDELEYELAIIHDKRTYFQYYWSVLKKNQLIIFTFVPTDDFNLIYVKIALFIISFGLFITINGFFFSDDTMHKVYEDNGEYNLIYQIPQIFYSSVISSLANALLRTLSLSENNILELKKEAYFDLNKGKKKARQIEKCLRRKLILFFIISFILQLFFWYFISCFCAVYRNTQVILLKDTGISFGLSMLYPFALCFLPGIFRIPALRAKEKNMKCLYKFSNFVNWLI